MIYKNLGPSMLACFFISSLLASECHEMQMIQRLDTYTRGKLDRGLVDGLKALVDPATKTQSLPLPQHGKFPLLFEAYPALQTKIAHVSFCDLPTPVIDCKIAKKIGARKIYIKDDGKTGKKVDNRIPFGGNKPRKLEFLLADALMRSCEAILVRGGTGTNFGLAAALYANLLGLKTTLLLSHQPNAYTVQRNLLLMLESGAQLRVVPNRALAYATLAVEFLNQKQQTGKFPYLIPTGGSHPIGVLGFVNAVFELQQQIKAGILEEPDYIYAAAGNGTGGMPGNGAGSAGTITGLALGLQLTGLKSQLVAVHVEPEEVSGELIIDIKKMFHDTNALLHAADPSIPLYEFPKKFAEIKEFCGEDYGLFTKEAMTARALLLETDGIKLDGTYTGKAFAGMLNMIEKQSLQEKSHLFWDGYCAEEFKDVVSRADYRKLPKAVHKYFEEPVQPLDSKL